MKSFEVAAVISAAEKGSQQACTNRDDRYSFQAALKVCFGL